MKETDKTNILIFATYVTCAPLSDVILEAYPKYEIWKISDIETAVDTILTWEVDLIIADVNFLARETALAKIDLIGWARDYAPTEISILLIGEKENPPAIYRGQEYFQTPIDTSKLKESIKRLT